VESLARRRVERAVTVCVRSLFVLIVSAVACGSAAGGASKPDGDFLMSEYSRLYPLVIDSQFALQASQKHEIVALAFRRYRGYISSAYEDREYSVVLFWRPEVGNPRNFTLHAEVSAAEQTPISLQLLNIIAEHTKKGNLQSLTLSEITGGISVSHRQLNASDCAELATLLRSFENSEKPSIKFDFLKDEETTRRPRIFVHPTVYEIVANQSDQRMRVEFYGNENSLYPWFVNAAVAIGRCFDSNI